MIFSVIIDRDEDGIWVVECPSIPGCVSQGQAKDEALENIRDAIYQCLQVRGTRFAFDYRNPASRGGCIMPFSLPVLSQVGRNKTTQAWRVVAFPAISCRSMPETLVLACARKDLFLPTGLHGCRYPESMDDI